VHTAWDLGIGDSTAIWFFQTIERATIEDPGLPRACKRDHSARLTVAGPAHYRQSTRGLRRSGDGEASGTNVASWHSSSHHCCIMVLGGQIYWGSGMVHFLLA
jgi:hypothetical protein